jgi:hypothetical protein
MSFSLPQADLGRRGGQALGVVPSSASSGEAYNQVKHLVGWIFFLLFFLVERSFLLMGWDSCAWRVSCRGWRSTVTTPPPPLVTERAGGQ